VVVTDGIAGGTRELNRRIGAGKEGKMEGHRGRDTAKRPGEEDG
jgi:hypothetical protein